MSEDCGKVPYPNPLAAWRVILSFTKPEHYLKHKEVDRPLRAYRCAQCHQWHLTHQPPPRKPRLALPAWPSPLRRISA